MCVVAAKDLLQRFYKCPLLVFVKLVHRVRVVQANTLLRFKKGSTKKGCDSLLYSGFGTTF